MARHFTKYPSSMTGNSQITAANTWKLDAIHDNCASFYGKATIEKVGDELHLLSYGTHVATLVKDENGDGVVVDPYTNMELTWKNANTGWSRTTTRHIREFIAQKDSLAEYL